MRNRSVTTIRDVAREAQVSVATVSHVFNRTRYVSPQTEELVKTAAARLNYRPSGLARSLSTHRTHLVGVAVADVLNPYFSMIIRGLEDRLWQHGYSLTVCSTDESQEKENHYLSLMLERRVDAMVIAPTGYPQPIFSEIINHQIALVFVDRRPPEALAPVVEIDNFKAGVEACEYLIGLGHQRIALITRNLFLSTAQNRTRGYRHALESHGLALDPNLHCVIDSTLEAAESGMHSLLNQPNPPSAVIATNHIITLGVLMALKKAGVCYPRDLSLVGFDDNPWVSAFTPSLTVIRHPIDLICNATVDALLAMLGDPQMGNTAASSPVPVSALRYPDIILKPELIIRQSCQAWHPS